MRKYLIPKEKEIVCEDAATYRTDMIAVSDGAGGGGVFADRWSQYLVDNLPDKPIKNYKAFDKWVDRIWEPFYNECEGIAKSEGGMFLNKFYDEGSFATIVAVWKGGQWISYGDSVAFCYNRKTKELQHSFTRLVDFNNPPYLINCKDPLDEKGFRSGKFKIDKDCVVFVASDALAHYILMMYEADDREKYALELEDAINAQTKNSNYIMTSLGMKKVVFEDDVITKLQNCTNETNFIRHLKSLKDKGLLGHDDYSLVIM